MSWLNAFNRRIKSLTGPQPDTYDEDNIADPDIETPLGVFGSTVISILVFPLQVLFLPMRFLGLFHQTGVQNDHELDDLSNLSFGARLWHQVKKVGQFVVQLPYLIVTSPIRFFQGVAKSSTREVLFIVPAVLMAGFLIYVAIQVIGRPETISNQYSKEIQTAMDEGDFDKAKTVFSRVMQNTELSQPQMLQWMVVLAETGELDRAEEILNELAPDDAVGYAPAHKIKALHIASQLKQSGKLDRLELLEKHLSRSHDESPPILDAWAFYYKHVDKPDEAIRALAKAAEHEPRLFTVIAQYQGELGRTRDQLETLKIAEKHFRELLDEKPLHCGARVLLANSLSQQQRYDEAEKVLAKGVALTKDLDKNDPNKALIRVATAEFFTMRHDLEKETTNNTAKRIQYLFAALATHPDHAPIYERLVKLAAVGDPGDPNAVRIRDELKNLISKGANPMAHFAMSNILWEQGERELAESHLEIAYKMTPKFSIVLNNLAWILAHQEQPDLERALELAEKAVEAAPADGRYRDTRGSIYLKLERYKDAIADFQLALKDAEGKIAVRKKLALAYEKIGMDDQAKIQKDIVDAAESSGAD